MPPARRRELAPADEEPADDDARPGQTAAERGPVNEGPVDATSTGFSTSAEASPVAGLGEEAPEADGPSAVVD